jgi:hypothetical protein
MKDGDTLMAHIRPVVASAVTLLSIMAVLAPPVNAQEQIPDTIQESLDGTYMVSFEKDVSGSAQERVLSEADVEILDVVSSGTVLVAAQSTSEANSLLQDPAVAAVEPDHLITLEQSTGTQATTPTNWAFDRQSSYGANLPGLTVEQGAKKSRAYVAVLDTGIDITHPAIAPHVWTNPRDVANGVDDDGNGFIDDVHGWDFASDTPDVSPSSSTETHGTSVAGMVTTTAAAAGQSGSVGIIAGKIFQNGQGKASDGVRAINYMVDLKLRQRINVVVINTSWSTPVFSYALRDALWAAGDAGILVTAAAAHYEDANGNPITRYPAAQSCTPWWHPNWDCVIGVTAHSSSGALPSFAGRDPSTVKMSAPGDGLVAAMPGGGYKPSAGTSLAAPIVASAIAMCRAAAPTLTSEKVLSYLYASGTPTASLQTTTVSGARLNIAGLLNGCGSTGGTYGEQVAVAPAGPNQLKVTGWARPDSPTATTTVAISVDGVPMVTVPADRERADKTKPTKTYGAAAGYEVVVPAAAGIREICSTPLAGVPQCSEFRVGDGPSPTGTLSPPALKENQWEMTGWALDPETYDNVTVDLYVDGVLRDSTVAYEPHADFEAGWPGWKNKGFRVWWDRDPGKKQNVCAVARNKGAGGDVLLGCQTIASAPGHNPIGNMEAGIAAAGGIQLQGWALDPDTAANTTVHIYVNNRFSGAVNTDVNRPDVHRFYPSYERSRGFSARVAARAGVNNVCVYGINAHVGNTNTLLGCRSVTVLSGNPIGAFDQVTVRSDRRPVVRGWTLDPETAAPINVHMYVNGRYVTQATANGSRPDVGRVYPGYGNNHGYDVTLSPLPPGTHTVCVYAINVGAGTYNPQLGCRAIKVT